MDCLQNLYGSVESLSEFISSYVSFSVHFDSVQQLNHHQDHHLLYHQVVHCSSNTFSTINTFLNLAILYPPETRRELMLSSAEYQECFVNL